MNSRERAAAKRLMNAALALRADGRRKEALRLALGRRALAKKVAPLAGMIATLYFEGDEFPAAALWYARAVQLAPRSEMASLGLFHSLWDSGRQVEALGEMRRFLGMTESREYSRILRDLRQEFFGAQSGQALAKLSIDERLAVNMAERAALLWRKDPRTLSPMREFAHA